MKNSLIFILLLVFYVESSRNSYNFFPNLPSGEYRVDFKAILKCESSKEYRIQQNVYLNRKSRNVTELKGNLTIEIPFDDSLKFHVNLAVKDSIGGWKENALSYSSPKGCSTLKFLAGNVWPKLLNYIGNKNTNCPIPPGVYIIKDYDLTQSMSSWNIPQVFFYGTYKARVHFTDKNNKIVCCIIYVIEIKRLWELE